MVRIGQSERMRTNIKNVMSLNALADAFTEYQMSKTWFECVSLISKANWLKESINTA